MPPRKQRATTLPSGTRWANLVPTQVQATRRRSFRGTRKPKPGGSEVRSIRVVGKLVWRANVNNYSEQFRAILLQLCAQSPERVEYEQLEIKGWCNNERQLTEKVVEATSCLANAQGGTVIVGVAEEPPRFSSCPFRNVTAAWLETRIKDQTIPPVECEVHDLTALLAEVRGASGANAFGIVIPKTRHLCAHVTTAGISKIRVGKDCRPYFTTADDDRTRAIAHDASLEDLSLTSINWAIDRYRTTFGMRDSPLEPIEFLARANLVERCLMDGERYPRYRVSLAALILFGKQTALARFLPFFETVFDFCGQHRTIRRNVVESVQELVLSSQFGITALCPQLPVETVREILVNAYIHRCWRTAAPVMITLTASEIEIGNPGDLLPGLNPGNLLHCVPA